MISNSVQQITYKVQEEENFRFHINRHRVHLGGEGPIMQMSEDAVFHCLNFFSCGKSMQYFAMTNRKFYNIFQEAVSKRGYIQESLNYCRDVFKDSRFGAAKEREKNELKGLRKDAFERGLTLPEIEELLINEQVLTIQDYNDLISSSRNRYGNRLEKAVNIAKEIALRELKIKKVILNYDSQIGFITEDQRVVKDNIIQKFYEYEIMKIDCRTQVYNAQHHALLAGKVYAEACEGRGSVCAFLAELRFNQKRDALTYRIKLLNLCGNYGLGLIDLNTLNAERKLATDLFRKLHTQDLPVKIEIKTPKVNKVQKDDSECSIQ